MLARREVAVERADANAGFARDRAHVGPEPVRDQDRPGGGDDLQPVPGGIFAPGLLGRFGRPVQLTGLPALPCLICLIRLIAGRGGLGSLSCMAGFYIQREAERLIRFVIGSPATNE